MAVLNFNAATVEPQKPLETVPAGWYTVQMVKSDAQPTKNGKGSYLETEYEIMYPVEHKGRKLFDRFNLQNDNPQAVELAYRALSAVCHAVGVIQVQDSQQLHGKPLQAKVKLVPAGPGSDGKYYDAKNEISGYKPVEGGAFTGGVSTSAPAAAPAWATGNPQPAVASGGVTPPWAGQPAQAPAPSAPATPPWATGAANPNTAPSYNPATPAPAQAPWGTPMANPPMSGPAATPSAPTPPWAAQPAQQPTPQAPVQGGAPTPPWAQAPAPQAPTGGAPTPPWAGGAPAQGGAPVPPWAQR